MDIHSPLFRHIAATMAAVLLLNPVVSLGADLALDTAAGGNASLTQAANGVPVVNIATPNSKGLSHNRFREYNVGKQGLILNNAQHATQSTQLGGIILGNKNLSGGAAGLILNEVTGANPSQLRGYTEVAGRAAHVIVANPHGISCDGCGFINTPRVTLSTGTPVIDQGRLGRFDVDGGEILIHGEGLNASNVGQFDLIARSARVNAELHAKDLSIIAGRNQVDAATLQATAKEDDGGEKPLLAVDSSALGGMYAGAIHLVGTEQGVGVRLAGNMAASAGDIRIDANGKLSLARTAAQRDVQLSAQNIELQADTYAGRDARVHAQQLTVADTLAAGRNARLQAETLDNAGVIEAGVRVDGSRDQHARLELTGSKVNNRGQITSHGELLAEVKQLDNSKAQISSAGHARVQVEQLNNQQGQILAQGDLELVTADALNNREGTLIAGQSLALTARALDNRDGTVASSRQIAIELDGVLNNDAGLLEAGTQLEVTAGSLSNAQGQIRALDSSGQSAIDVSGQLNNDQGLVEIGNATLSLAADRISNLDGRVRHLGNAGLHIDTHLLGQAGGSFSTNSVLELDAREWVNRSLIQAAAIVLDVEQLTQAVDAGLLAVGSLHAQGDYWRNEGRIEAGTDLTLELSATYQGNGSLVAGANLLLNAQDVRNEEGLIFSGEDMHILAERVENRRGDIYSLGNLLIAGDMQGGMAERLSNLSGTIETAGAMTVAAGQIENAREVFEIDTSKYSARLVHVGCTDCSGTNEDALFRLDEYDRTEVIRDSASAQLLAAGNMQLSSSSLDNRYSLIAAGGNLRIDTGQLNNQGAQTGEVHNSRVLKSHRVRAGRVGRQIADANSFSARNWHGSGSYNPTNLQAELNTFFNRHVDRVYSTSQPVLSNVEYHHATIQAAGDLQIMASEHFNNSLIRPSFDYVSGGTRDPGSSVPGDDTSTNVTLNPQLPPDLTQQPVGSPHLRLPSGDNGLFRLNRNPGHGYLIETNPALTNLRLFMGSDYLLSHMGYDPNEAQKRLGDGLYEQRLVREAVLARTGQRYLAGLTSDEAMYRYLMDNALASKDALNLSLGVSLSAEQVAALTHDIVWLEEQEVMGEQVLVPVLYLAQAEGRLAPTGTLIQGRDLLLISGGELANQGTLRASRDLTASAGNISNSGLLQTGERLQLLATESIRNAQGGIISGADVTLVAGEDILNERNVTTHRSSIGNRAWGTSFTDEAGRIEAVNSLSLTAGRDVANLGGVLNSGGDMTIAAGRDVSISSVQQVEHTSRGDRLLIDSTRQLGAEVNAGGNLSIDAGRDLGIVASDVRAGNDMLLQAGRDLVIASAANESQYYSKSSRVTREESQIQQQGAELSAGGDMSLLAGQNLIAIASRLEAGGEAYLVAGDQLALLASEDLDHSYYEKKSKGSFGRKSFRSDQVTRITQQGTEIVSGGDLSLISGGDQTYQAASLRSGADLELASGGAIIFEGVKDLHQESHEKSKSSWAWQSAKGKGHTDETLVQSQLIAQGELAIKAVEGLQIDIKHIDQHTVSQTIDAMVQADPNLAWLKEMEQRGDVDWQRVKEVHDSFSYSSSGLSGPAAMVVAIVVAYFTAGAASGAIGAAAGAGAGSGGAMAAAGTSAMVTAGTAVGTAGAGWANAALTAAAVSAAGGAAVSTINNRGDLGNVLDDVTSSDALKGYLATAITAGATSGILDSTFGANSDSINRVTGGFELGTPSGLADFGTYLGAQGTLQAVTQTAIMGGSLEDNLQAALTDQLHHLLQAGAFNAAGDLAGGKWTDIDWADGSAEKVALHAVVGGLLSEATGGDFTTGALAAGANEALIEQLSGAIKDDRNLELAVSQLIGIGAATITGGDHANAAELAKNATAYNRQLHPAEVKQIREQADELAAELGISPAEAERRLAEAQAYFVDERYRQVIEAQGVEFDEATLRHLGTALAPLAHQYEMAPDGDVPAQDDLTRVYSPEETLTLLQNYHVNHTAAFQDSLMYAEYLYGNSGNAHDQRAFYEANLNYSGGADPLGALTGGLSGSSAAVVERLQGLKELAQALVEDFGGTSEQVALALLAAAASPDRAIGDFQQARMDAENEAYLYRLQGDHESAAYVEEKWKTDFALNFVAASRTGGIVRVGPNETKAELPRNRSTGISLDNIASSLHAGQQGKHILGHNNYILGRSFFNDGVDPQKLLDGTHAGEFPVVDYGSRGQPIVDFGRNIGVDAASGLETRFGTIHSGKNGAHIVPTNPTTVGVK